MKKQIKKQTKITPYELSKKTKALKWVIIGLGIAILALWISWFTCDCIFISKGIYADYESSKLWSWDKLWYKISSTQAIVMLSLLGGYISLLLAYMVICGLNLKVNFKQCMYQLITIGACFIAITICVIKSAEMMINEKFVLDAVISFLPPSVSIEVYHIDFLKWLSIPAGAVIFGTVIILLSFKQFTINTLIKDTNILIMAYAVGILLLYGAFAATMGWNDPSYEEISEAIFATETWKHIVCQCITSPIGTFAGMTMVLLLARLICVIFIYNNRWHEKKAHIIIFCIITFLVFTAFIASHVSKMDFGRLVTEYNSIKLPILLVITAETVTCGLAGIYCLVSHVRYAKRVNK